MAFIGIKIPKAVANDLSRIKVPGDHISTDEMHITLLFLGDDVSMPSVLKAVTACYMMTKRWAPFRVGIRHATCFPGSPDGKTPIIASVLSLELHRLQAALRKSLDFMKLDYSKKFPDFKPHVTLSYSDQPIPIIQISPIVWKVGELVIWGGDEGSERIAITLPLEGGPDVDNPLRTMLQL